ncbi:hypothetical protein N7462_008314 [Penicillium macrosclerotiorum]|uniref:uncharacterized protein n=1 Tax=Penicillium macrosclerotiorum TaxID=303699 RepID=UPI002548A2F8|nr:uncharacterized protein N7462_008314 [Penicillium macrosclerotiorum]KAJ5675417.1 hypothetical protein N7462_008314 [Penicillium macrosclerotiorum]
MPNGSTWGLMNLTPSVLSLSHLSSGGEGDLDPFAAFMVISIEAVLDGIGSVEGCIPSSPFTRNSDEREDREDRESLSASTTTPTTRLQLAYWEEVHCTTTTRQAK